MGRTIAKLKNLVRFGARRGEGDSAVLQMISRYTWHAPGNPRPPTLRPRRYISCTGGLPCPGGPASRIQSRRLLQSRPRYADSAIDDLPNLINLEELA